MLALLVRIATGEQEANANQVRAAIAAVAYTHAKPDTVGKKPARKEAAAGAGDGRFGPMEAPKLVVNNA